MFPNNLVYRNKCHICVCLILGDPISVWLWICKDLWAHRFFSTLEQTILYESAYGDPGVWACVSHTIVYSQLPWVRTPRVRMKWRTQLGSRVAFRHLCFLATEGSTCGMLASLWTPIPTLKNTRASPSQLSCEISCLFSDWCTASAGRDPSQAKFPNFTTEKMESFDDKQLAKSYC